MQKPLVRRPRNGVEYFLADLATHTQGKLLFKALQHVLADTAHLGFSVRVAYAILIRAESFMNSIRLILLMPYESATLSPPGLLHSDYILQKRIPNGTSKFSN